MPATSLTYVRDRCRQLKRRAVSYMGGQCSSCGYKKNLAALTFHHKDSSSKKFLIASHNLSWERIKVELSKCELICANCHFETHAIQDWETNLSISSSQRLRRKRKTAMVLYKGGKCQNCGYTKCLEALTFHHRPGEFKAYNVSQVKREIDEVLPELDKCDLLCFNCHQTSHNPELSVLN